MPSPSSAANKSAAAYVRRSTDRQEQSLGDQLKAIHDYAATSGYHIVKTYTDDALSGASATGRAGFQQLVADAQQRNCPFKTLLVYSISRLGRGDNDESGHYRWLLRQGGVEVVYVAEHFNGDDSDDLLRPVRQWQARQELKSLSAVTIRGLVSRAEDGWWCGGIPPFGYDLEYIDAMGNSICFLRFMPDGSRKVLDVDGTIIRTIPQGDSMSFSKKDRSRLVLSSPDRVAVVKMIFQLSEEGLGSKTICNRLNSEHIPPPMGGRRRTSKAASWCQNSITNILTNPVYLGSMTWNRRSFAKFHRISDSRAIPVNRLPTGGNYPNVEADWLTVPGTHSAIISEAQFAQAQQRHENTSRFGLTNKRQSVVGRGSTSPFLLSGLITCHHCGHKWLGITNTKGRKRKDGTNVISYGYACGGSHKGAAVCTRRTFPKGWLESQVIRTVSEQISTFHDSARGQDRLRKAISNLQDERTSASDAELLRLNSRLYEIEQRISILLDTISPTTREMIEAKIVTLKTEESDIRLKLQAMDSARIEQAQVGELIECAVSLSRDFEQVMILGNVEEQRRLLRAFVKEINIDPISGKCEVTVILLPGLRAPIVLKAA